MHRTPHPTPRLAIIDGFDAAWEIPSAEPDNRSAQANVGMHTSPDNLNGYYDAELHDCKNVHFHQTIICVQQQVCLSYSVSKAIDT